MRHALIILAGVLSIGATWIGDWFLTRAVDRHRGAPEFQIQRVAILNGISRLAVIITGIILVCIFLNW
jgi:hypothetical protein